MKASLRGVMEMVTPESMMTGKQFELCWEKGRFQENSPMVVVAMEW